jgi:hypothetical protein
VDLVYLERDLHLQPRILLNLVFEELLKVCPDSRVLLARTEVRPQFEHFQLLLQAGDAILEASLCIRVPAEGLCVFLFGVVEKIDAADVLQLFLKELYPLIFLVDGEREFSQPLLKFGDLLLLLPENGGVGSSFSLFSQQKFLRLPLALELLNLQF